MLSLAIVDRLLEEKPVHKISRPKRMKVSLAWFHAIYKVPDFRER
jgi:hypothetical protein